MKKPYRYDFNSRHDYRQAISAWIKQWKKWRADRKKKKEEK